MYDIFSATVFDGNWTLKEHVRVCGILWEQIMQTKAQEFRENIQVNL